jgi:hypothetical protein
MGSGWRKHFALKKILKRAKVFSTCADINDEF